MTLISRDGRAPAGSADFVYLLENTLPELDAQLPLLRARLARATRTARTRADDTDAERELLDARRAYVAARIEDFARRALADAPPLDAEQRTRLATLLSSGHVEGAA